MGQSGLWTWLTTFYVIRFERIKQPLRSARALERMQQVPVPLILMGFGDADHGRPRGHAAHSRQP